VVDPDVVLSRVARKERWPVEIWHQGTAPRREETTAAPSRQASAERPALSAVK
jgi:hypothetical protein